MTPLIILVNIAVFALMVLRGVSWMDPTSRELVKWGADFGPLTTNGEWWRTVTSMFLHIGIIHLAFNMYALYRVGELTERLFGNLGFAVLYLLAGVGGSVASLYRNPEIVSAGASGAIFGLFGGLIAFLLVQRHAIPPKTLKSLMSSAVGLVLFNVVFGATVPGIDMAAHIGGLVAGLIVGLLLTQSLTNATARNRLRRGVVALAVGGAVMVAFAARISGRGDDTAQAMVAAVRRELAEEPQARPGSVQGTVTDPAGTGMQGVTVTAATADGQTHMATTREGGSYRLELPPARYTITFSAPGFKNGVVPATTVVTNETTPLDRQMEAGSSDPTKG